MCLVSYCNELCCCCFFFFENGVVWSMVLALSEERFARLENEMGNEISFKGKFERKKFKERLKISCFDTFCSTEMKTDLVYSTPFRILFSPLFTQYKN